MVLLKVKSSIALCDKEALEYKAPCVDTIRENPFTNRIARTELTKL